MYATSDGRHHKQELRTSGLGLMGVLLALLLTLVLVACQPAAATPATAPSNTPAATETPPPTNIPAPTDTPVPTDAPVPTPAEAMASPSVTVLEETPTLAEQAAVKLVNLEFAPRELTVKVGATVVWTSEDNPTHTVTADDGSFDSGRMRKGDTFSHTFTQVGEYPYHCAFHGAPGGVGMSGVVIVTN